ncbi:MAG: hypothetical protein ACOC9T_00200 [Myxococcota bacterium]
MDDARVLAEELAETLGGKVIRTDHMLTVQLPDGRCPMSVLPDGDVAVVFAQLPPDRARALARALRAILDGRDPVGDVWTLLWRGRFDDHDCAGVDGRSLCRFCGEYDGHAERCRYAPIAAYYEETSHD